MFLALFLDYHIQKSHTFASFWFDLCKMELVELPSMHEAENKFSSYQWAEKIEEIFWYYKQHPDRWKVDMSWSFPHLEISPLIVLIAIVNTVISKNQGCWTRAVPFSKQAHSDPIIKKIAADRETFCYDCIK